MNTRPSGGADKMFSLIHALPSQLAASAECEGLESVATPPGGFQRVLLCGMGGSAIAADLVQPLIQHQPIALDVWRDYGLPHWVDHRCLIIAASYSGQTEETLSGLAEAQRRGCPIVGITSGGRLAEVAAVAPFPCVILPGGLPPRAALGYGLGALVRVLGRLGLVADVAGEIDEAVRVLQELDSARRQPSASETETALSRDPAGMINVRALAQQLVDAIPVIYTAEPETHGAGVRLKGQINENSKSPACLAVFPELNHNDLVGWVLPANLKGRFVLLILGQKPDNERLATRVKVTQELLADDFPEVHRLFPCGDRMLARVLSLVQYGDYLSCHLAQLKNIDPVPVDRIDQLKKNLEKI